MKAVENSPSSALIYFPGKEQFISNVSDKNDKGVSCPAPSANHSLYMHSSGEVKSGPLMKGGGEI